ncbi:SDR family NAD(P)-dependent oxidoreductase [Amycolatopsis rhabdoformis]|uniref:SDR family NAD(P)-dependent oxidoreductase n=1 Tax=Amycolatopsis rhabdoformis TaxID=1448059 RepID=A0ABZ1IK57_9PSEU|nr:SDR family NAD(P)-dependent oxidoreductase [Amycolatopsis rhabdoformis]WSE34146.1 SDR family NAD(P)-dependent oxidoreductase [Amycolatopsis rhabdoformis]
MSLLETPFGFAGTAAEVAAGIDLTGRRAVVTGASSGLGIETARALAGTGAEVTLAVRDRAAGQRAAEDITATTGSTALRVARLDLTDPVSMAAFTGSWEGPLHLLVADAGVMATPERDTRRTGSGSSPPTTWATSLWPPGCTQRRPRTARPGS